MSKLKLEVGKSYRNRRGDVVTIVEYNPAMQAWNYIGNNASGYNEDGSWFDPKAELPMDLIEEVETEQDKEQDKVFPLEQDYSLPSYNPNVEAVWNAYVGTIPSDPLHPPTLDTLIAARKQLVEAFANG